MVIVIVVRSRLLLLVRMWSFWWRWRRREKIGSCGGERRRMRYYAKQAERYLPENGRNNPHIPCSQQDDIEQNRNYYDDHLQRPGWLGLHSSRVVLLSPSCFCFSPNNCFSVSFLRRELDPESIPLSSFSCARIVTPPIMCFPNYSPVTISDIRAGLSSILYQQRAGERRSRNELCSFYSFL